MDKTLRAFVIVACTVVIATPVVLITDKVVQEFIAHSQRVSEEQATAERTRQRNRRLECSFRAENPESYSKSFLMEDFMEACMNSTVPVDQFRFN